MSKCTHAPESHDLGGITDEFCWSFTCGYVPKGFKLVDLLETGTPVLVPKELLG